MNTILNSNSKRPIDGFYSTFGGETNIKNIYSELMKSHTDKTLFRLLHPRPGDVFYNDSPTGSDASYFRNYITDGFYYPHIMSQNVYNNYLNIIDVQEGNIIKTSVKDFDNPIELMSYFLEEYKANYSYGINYRTNLPRYEYKFFIKYYHNEYLIKGKIVPGCFDLSP